MQKDRYQTTFETYNKVAQAYQDKFLDMDLYNDTYDLFCQLLPQPGARIFEIACGPGNITRYLAQQRPDFKIAAIDIAPNMLELARTHAPEASFAVMDARDIHQLAPGFDGIICGFGLPYLSKEDTTQLIRNCTSLLQDQGIFYCSLVPGDETRSGFQTGSTGDQVYFYYHEEAWLLQELRACHLEAVALIRKAYPLNDGGTQEHLIVLARKSK